MNTERTSSTERISSSALRPSSSARRPLALAFRQYRLVFAWLAAALVMAGLATAAQAGLKPSASGGTGAVLALAAQLRTARLRAAAASGHTPDGRTLLPRRMMRSGALVKAHAAATASVVPISGSVQTYDVNNPPPAFRPLIGFGSPASLNNSSTNPPVFIGTLAPTNLTPVWSADETFFVFSSNRTALGGVNTDGDGGTPRFHLWAISVNGGQAFQITASTGPAGGGEFFPALSRNNLALTFTSDASTPNIQNLYALGFSFSTLYSGAVAPTNLTPSPANPNPPASLTLRGSSELASAQVTGFDQVQRPTFSPNDNQLIVFSAHSVNFSNNGDVNAGHNHLYFLYTSSGGFSQGNNVSFPGKLTNGPADDTDPTFAPDGSYIAFASTANAAGFTRNPNNAFGPTNPASPQDPNASQSLSSGASSTRSIFLISGGLSTTGVPFGTVPNSGTVNLSSTGGRVSRGGAGGFDDYGPAWSSFANQNQFTNPTGDSAYLAFARSAGANAPHDISFFMVGSGVSNPTTESLTPETVAGGANPSVKLNTDDNAGETTTTGNAFDDIYPTWSPFLSIFSIAYSSNRTVTYNNPASGAPVEVAASVGDGGTVINTQDATQNYSVGASYAGLLVSQVLNLDPPTLLRFSAGEVVHVQAGSNANPVTGTPNKLAVSGGQAVTLTVRLSDRESGIDNTGGPNGGARVYVQLKDPDSKYQDSQNAEHKVFMKDRRFDSQPVYNTSGVQTGIGPQINARLSQETSGTANGLLDIYNYALPLSDLYSSLYYNPNPQRLRSLPTYQKYAYPSYGDATGSYNPIVNNIGIFLESFDNQPSNATRGVHGGQWAADPANNPSGTYIFVGKSGGGTNDGTKNGTQQPTDEGKSFPTAAPATTNPAAPAVPASSYTFPVPGGRAALPYPYSDPRQFIPTGAEYEAQVVNPQFLTAGTTGDTVVGDPTVTAGYPGGYTQSGRAMVARAAGAVGDYVDPYYLAGVEDQGAFSGGTFDPTAFTSFSSAGRTGTDRPVAGYTTRGTAVDGTATTTTHPAEWLQLSRVPAAQQDNNGGVLYTVTWTTPTSGSDFFVDVIAYDKATFPTVPGSQYSGARANWRIYDNVGGFSTNQSIDNRDILLVSDYALGQKFAATTFGGRNTNLNLVPKLFGTESYTTDVDINLLPDSVYVGIPTTEKSYLFNAVVQPFLTDNVNFAVNPIFPNNPNYGIITVAQTAAQNGLGALSYNDGVINDGVTTQDGAPYVQSQRYSIWRILARGPVPASVLNSYLPTPVSQPAIADPAGITAPAATVLDAPRCVVWQSPYTGDVLADPGTIDDPGNVGTAGVTNPRQSTTSILTAFVQAGGRLCVTGQDVGSTLTQSGTVGNTPGPAGSPNFLPDVLTARLVPNTSGGNVLAGTDNRITGNPFYDHSNNGNYVTLNGPIQGGYSVNQPNYPYQDNLVLGDADYGDGALSQIPAFSVVGPAGSASIQGQTDVLTAVGGSSVAMTYSGGGTAMVFHNDPYNPAGSGKLPNGGTGSRVVYAGFGLEGLTNDFFSSNQPNPGQGPPANQIIPFDQLIPQVIPRNPRSAVLHNIVSFLRSGRVSGTITQTAGTGQGGGLGIDGVTVYLRPTGAAPPTRVAFSALTAGGGRFTIAGVEPGTYTLVAVKPGFQRAVSNSGVVFTVEGDVTKTNATLTMTPQQPGNIAGAVHDTAGTLISGSTVTFTSQDNSVTQSVTSQNGSVTGNTAENYFLQTVPVTTYTATASSPTNPQNLPEYTAATKPDAPPAGSPAGTPDFSQGVTVQPNTTVQPVNFTLTPILATIKGTVTSAGTGTPPVPGATVTLKDSTGATVGTAVTTAADGTYTLTNIPAAQTATTYTIVVTAPGFAPSTPLSETVYLGSVLTNQNVVLTPIPPGSILVTVNYSTGGPVAGAIVSFTAPGATAPQTATTGANGTVVIPNVPPATYTVTAVGPNNANGRVTTSTAAAQQVVVTSGQQATATFTVVPIAPSFSGTVTSTAASTPSSKPLPNATITVTGTDASGAAIAPITIKTDSKGNYTTGPLAPGTYTLTASLAGFTSSAIGPTTVQLGDVLTSQNFMLGSVAPGSITGLVHDDHGTPVSGATVTFTSTDGTQTAGPVKTAADGTYVIPPSATGTKVPAFTYTGTAVGPNNANGKPEYGTAAPQTVTVPAGGSGTANFTLPAILASVSGKVTDIQTSGAVAGATVTLTDPFGGVTGTQTTGNDGSFTFAGILSTENGQPYTLSVTKTGYTPGSATVTVSLGDAVTQNVPLNEQATLYGLVTDGSANATGQPLGGVTLTVTDGSGNVVATLPTPLTTTAATATGPDGLPQNYTATLLPGTYTVTATKGSYTTQTSVTITLTNAAPVRVNFALVSAIGTLGGLVTDQNGTGLVSGATVTVVPTGTGATTGTVTGISFTTTATATPGPDGSPINYSGQLTQGTYSVTVTKGSRTTAAKTVTVAGGAFTRLDFTAATGLPALHTFSAGFQFVSTPYDYSALGFNGLFGPLNTAPAGTTANGNRSNVAVWNPLTGAYALDPNAPADTLRLGVGYWVYLKNAVPVTQQGATPLAATVSVSLGKGWNQIGVPNPSAAGIPVANLKFDNGAGGTITFSQASSSQYNLVLYPLYAYAGGGYQTVSANGVLTPWNAYWIYVNAPATLEIPTR